MKNSVNITIEPNLSKIDKNIFEIKDKYIKVKSGNWNIVEPILLKIKI